MLHFVSEFQMAT